MFVEGGLVGAGVFTVALPLPVPNASMCFQLAPNFGQLALFGSGDPI